MTRVDDVLMFSVTKLTVSAGKSKEIQLPNNTVTLSAFVVPEQVEGKAKLFENK